MIEQLKTIRHAVEAALSDDQPYIEACKKAITALTQLEAMVGEPAGWRYQHDETGRHMCHSNDGINTPEDFMKVNPRWKLIGPMYAAPVAQQYEAGDVASAAAQGFRDGVASVTQQEPVAYYYQKHNCFGQLVWNVGFVAPGDATHCYPLYTAAPVAQQPQAKPHKPLFADLIAQHPGLREELLEMDKQPQAEAVQYTRADLDRAYSAGLVEGERLAIQQVEAGPSDVVRDAERYRFLAAHCRSTPEHWGGRWSIVIEGPCPERQDCEDAFDAAIDAAIAQQKGRP